MRGGPKCQVGPRSSNMLRSVPVCKGKRPRLSTARPVTRSRTDQADSIRPEPVLSMGRLQQYSRRVPHSGRPDGPPVSEASGRLLSLQRTSDRSPWVGWIRRLPCRCDGDADQGSLRGGPGARPTPILPQVPVDLSIQGPPSHGEGPAEAASGGFEPLHHLGGQNGDRVRLRRLRLEPHRHGHFVARLGPPEGEEVHGAHRGREPLGAVDRPAIPRQDPHAQLVVSHGIGNPAWHQGETWRRAGSGGESTNAAVDCGRRRLEHPGLPMEPQR